MKVNDVLRRGDTYLRVLAVKDKSCFCINCKAITLRYAHLFPSKQIEITNKLEKERMGEENVS